MKVAFLHSQCLRLQSGHLKACTILFSSPESLNFFWGLLKKKLSGRGYPNYTLFRCYFKDFPDLLPRFPRQNAFVNVTKTILQCLILQELEANF